MDVIELVTSSSVKSSGSHRRGMILLLAYSRRDDVSKSFDRGGRATLLRDMVLECIVMWFGIQ